MENFELRILGCGSAIPNKLNNQTSQVLTLRGKSFMIDCGEGTQVQMRKFGVKTTRLNHVFISHLHGDHVFGLIGMISTLGLLGRTAELVIHAPADLEKILTMQLEYFCSDIPFKVRFNGVDTRKNELIFEDRTLQVYSIPLKHRVPCNGFLFREKPKQRHLLKEMIDFYKISIKDLARIKNGDDYVTPSGEVIANARLTREPLPPKSYAYCSDTAYYEKIIPMIENVDCLFHEATFLHEDIMRAKETGHSSARQAAEIALKANVGKLVIGHFSSRYTDQSPLLSEAQEIFPNTILGADGLTVTI